MVTNERILISNRKARFQYDILDSLEAGLVLVGTEIKAIREGRANLGGAYAKPEHGEIWLINFHIGSYSTSSFDSHDPTRPRKLLLHRNQITRLAKEASTKGLSIIPLRLYIKHHLAKVELGLAKGRRRHDKRQAIIDRDRLRETQRSIRRHL